MSPNILRKTQDMILWKILFITCCCANLWMTIVMAAEPASCDADDDGNCLDRSCDNKYPDCEKWASEGTFTFSYCTTRCICPSSP
jgi:hypothetical protein